MPTDSKAKLREILGTVSFSTFQKDVMEKNIDQMSDKEADTILRMFTEAEKCKANAFKELAKIRRK